MTTHLLLHNRAFSVLNHGCRFDSDFPKTLGYDSYPPVKDFLDISLAAYYADVHYSVACQSFMKQIERGYWWTNMAAKFTGTELTIYKNVTGLKWQEWTDKTDLSIRHKYETPDFNYESARTFIITETDRNLYWFSELTEDLMRYLCEHHISDLPFEWRGIRYIYGDPDPGNMNGNDLRFQVSSQLGLIAPIAWTSFGVIGCIGCYGGAVGVQQGIFSKSEIDPVFP